MTPESECKVAASDWPNLDQCQHPGAKGGWESKCLALSGSIVGSASQNVRKLGHSRILPCPCPPKEMSTYNWPKLDGRKRKNGMDQELVQGSGEEPLKKPGRSIGRRKV